MTKFRETLWFKKGELDEVAAEDPAEDAPGAADLLPVEDRYLDDGSLTPGDSESFGLHTGRTQHLVPLRDAPAGGPPDDALRTLVGELRGGGLRVAAAIGASVLAACAALLLFAS